MYSEKEAEESIQEQVTVFSRRIGNSGHMIGSVMLGLGRFSPML
jgi:hypothetical protein